MGDEDVDDWMALYGDEEAPNPVVGGHYGANNAYNQGQGGVSDASGGYSNFDDPYAFYGSDSNVAPAAPGGENTAPVTDSASLQHLEGLLFDSSPYQENIVPAEGRGGNPNDSDGVSAAAPTEVAAAVGVAVGVAVPQQEPQPQPEPQPPSYAKQIIESLATTVRRAVVTPPNPTALQAGAGDSPAAIRSPPPNPPGEMACAASIAAAPPIPTAAQRGEDPIVATPAEGMDAPPAAPVAAHTISSPVDESLSEEETLTTAAILTAHAIAAAEAGTHATGVMVRNALNGLVEAVGGAGGGMKKSTSSDSTDEATDAQKNAAALRNAIGAISDVCAESIRFSLDRSKAFTDHYVVANGLLGDDPEYQHSLEQQRRMLRQVQRIRQANGRDVGSLTGGLTAQELAELDAEWRAKCTLASLSWYQRQLIAETADSRSSDASAAKKGAGADPQPPPPTFPEQKIDEYEHVDPSEEFGTEFKFQGDRDEDYLGYYLHSLPSGTGPTLTPAGRAGNKNGGSGDGSNRSSDDDGGDETLTKAAFRERGAFAAHPPTLSTREILRSAEDGNLLAQDQLIRWFLPPPFAESDRCRTCATKFSARCFRHHCRHCGLSFCHNHARHYRRIHKYGYTTGAVRVCAPCAAVIEREEQRDRALWRVLRLKAYYAGALIPYFERRVDRGVDKAYRVATGTLHVMKNIVVFNYPARIILETIDVLRRYGLSGLAGVLMRQDFVEAVETLKKISGIDKVFALSLHELTACIYYKLAIERGLRGCNPTAEALEHDDSAFGVYQNDTEADKNANAVQADDRRNTYAEQVREANSKAPYYIDAAEAAEEGKRIPCRPANDDELAEATSLAPMALTFAYLPSPVDCERLAHTMGLDTLMFHNELQVGSGGGGGSHGGAPISGLTDEAEKPAYVLFATSKDPATKNHQRMLPASDKLAILAIRGTQTVHDIVTDIRAAPEAFPPADEEIYSHIYNDDNVTNNAWNTSILAGITAKVAKAAVSNASASASAGAGKSTSSSGSGSSDGSAAAEAGAEEEDDGEKTSEDLLHDYILSLHNNTTASKVSRSAAMRQAEIDLHKNRNKSSYEDWIWLRTADPACAPLAAAAGGAAGSSSPALKETKDELPGRPDPYSSYACGGMMRAALWMLREVGSSLLSLYKNGYRIRIVGHSLGGGVAALLTYMLSRIVLQIDIENNAVKQPHLQKIPRFKCFTYGCPSCVEERFSVYLRPLVSTVVLHDDVITRVTPNSIRALMKELMVFRGSIFRHLQGDWEDVILRASSLWSPQYRDAREPPSQAKGKSGSGGKKGGKAGGKTSLIAVPQAQPPAGGANVTAAKATSLGSAAPSDATMVNIPEEVLLDLYLPGDVMHIYSIYGTYRMAHVPHNFPALRHVPVQGNIFRDHRSDAIYDALLEVQAVRRAPKAPPVWTPYNSTDCCQCCNSRFTWHSTFRGEAQEYRERYNCRCCGRLVCGPCSDHKSHSAAVSDIGLVLPNNRVCDKCYYTGHFATNPSHV